MYPPATLSATAGIGQQDGKVNAVLVALLVLNVLGVIAIFAMLTIR